MKLLAVVCLFALAAPALAQDAAPITTCWYNQDGKLTGTSAGAPGTHIRYVYLTGRGGDKTWAYAIRSADAQECPARVPR